MARKLIFGIFIFFCSIFLMSHNASAFESTIPLRYIKHLPSNYLYWQDNNDGNTWRTSSFKNYGRSNASSSALYFRLSNASRSLYVNAYQYVVITGSFYSTSSYGGTSNTSGHIYAGSENLNCMIVDISTSDTYNDNSLSQSELITYVQDFVITCQMAQNVTSSIAINLRLETLGQTLVDYSGINFTSLTVFERDTSLYDIYTWLQNNSDDAGATLKQEKEDVQDASEQSETDSDTAQNDAEGASQSLLNATGSIVSALTSAPATDCLIDISTRQFTVGQVNLCSNVPSGVLSFVHGLIALVFTPIVLYFCYNIVTTLYNLFKEYNS